MPSLSKKKQERIALPEKVKGAIWSKMTEERDLKFRSVSNLGPGQYDPKQAKGHIGPSPAFKS